MKRVGVFVATGVMLALSACSTGAPSPRVVLVTSAAPIGDIACHVVGDTADVALLERAIPAPAPFTPTDASASILETAKLIVLNGFHFDGPALEIAQRKHDPTARLFVLGENAVPPDRILYDGGQPNPFVWLDLGVAERYAELIRDHVSGVDRGASGAIAANTRSYLGRLRALDDAIRTAVATIPPEARAIISFEPGAAYFFRRYGLRFVPAPAFARGVRTDHFVAAVVELLRRSKAGGILGAEGLPPSAQAALRRAPGIKMLDGFRTEGLPGVPGALEHSFAGLLIWDTRLILAGSGGSAAAIDSLSPERVSPCSATQQVGSPASTP